MPVICPVGSTSMARALLVLGRPGMSIMLPQMTTRKPAPAEREMSVTWRVQPVGAPMSLGLSEREYWVLAMQMGRWLKPQDS